ncbi:serine/threonine-protein kinase TBK1, partial [Silurus asotus]
TFAGDVGHLWKTSESLLVYQELVRKGVRGLIELMKEDFNEAAHKKAEVFHMCNHCNQTLEKTEQLCAALMQGNVLSTDYDEISDLHKKVMR